ncbi:hypothetical protein [Lactococcus allomyrinae]|uniref:Uncharacterized protein n=1 Tax=Lactococcus allomyrinae TaxID=2419773 RepID=A0A387BJC3_9LACT|nr:hypothetical protein [Lactococcus allomyrinae]AYG01147.1 hypothetical protein D7I46_08590 [Lactococcus allomyrinae]
MAYRMPEKMEDEYENRHGFRSQDMKPMAILLGIWIFVAIFLVQGLILKGLFLLLTGFLSYYLLLPNKKGKYGSSKAVRNWQIYANFLFMDHHTYKPMNLEDHDEV